MLYTCQKIQGIKEILFVLFTGPTSHEGGTYTGRRKVSQRQKRSRVSVGTQTEDFYFTDPRRSNMNGDEEYYEGQEDVFTRLAQTEESSTNQEEVQPETSWWLRMLS